MLFHGVSACFIKGLIDETVSGIYFNDYAVDLERKILPAPLGIIINAYQLILPFHDFEKRRPLKAEFLQTLSGG